MIAVRRATAADVPWLLAQLPGLDALFGARRSLVPDEATATATLGAWIEAPEVPFFVAERGGERGGERLGFLAGVLAPHPFNGAIRVLSEVLWWVVPPARGSAAAPRLLDAFLDYGRAHADWVVFARNVRTPVREASLARRGLRLTEHCYLLEVS